MPLPHLCVAEAFCFISDLCTPLGAQPYPAMSVDHDCSTSYWELAALCPKEP